MKELSGKLCAAGLKLGIVVSRFNSMITEKLLQGAVERFVSCGGDAGDLTVLHVPGSFEIPAAANRLAHSGRWDAIVCIGCLIRGETPHFDRLAEEVTRGIDEVALRHNLPVTYGVLTTDTVEQALNRAGIKYGNKGADAVSAAIEMATLFRELGEQ